MSNHYFRLDPSCTYRCWQRGVVTERYSADHAGSSPAEGDVEQGFQAGSEAEGQFSKSEEDNAIETVRFLYKHG